MPGDKEMVTPAEGPVGESMNTTTAEISVETTLSLGANIHPKHFILHKNNSFPQFQANDDPLRKNPLLEAATSVPGKRILPPIEDTDEKRFRAFSQSTSSGGDDNNETDDLQNQEESADIEYEKLDAMISQQLSQSSDESSSGSSSAVQLDDSADSSNSLHSKFFQTLNLSQLRSSSPTISTYSLPVPYSSSGWSPRDDDAKSTVSDCVTIKTSASAKQLALKLRKDYEKMMPKESSPLSTENETESSTCDGGLHFHSLPVGGDSFQHDDDDDDTTQEAFSYESTDYEEQETPKLPYTQSSGILPAIPSDKTRERSFLVGGLTKHGSLLGVDELHRYFPDRKLNVFVGTWNMQRKGIPKNLDDFILPKEQKYLQDMYVIGVQEATQDQKMWEIKLQETLGVNHVLAHSVSHGVLHLSVFVRRDLIWFCSSFEDDKVTVRMVSQVKTKGAVAIGFQFFGTSLLFINSHFHSGESRLKERVGDYVKIKEKLKLPKTGKVSGYHRGSDATSNYDCVFWFGDLNFRVNLPASILLDEIKGNGSMNVKEALKGDQLSKIMRKRRAFENFSEHRIRFNPTYKLIPGSDSYSCLPKQRTPSYTDRILFKNKEPNHVTCKSYDSVTNLKTSDHRPVHAFFDVRLKPGRDNVSFGVGKFRNDVYEKAARLRALGDDYQNGSSVCNIL